MDAREILYRVNNISYMLKDLFEAKDKTEIEEKLNVIRSEMEILEKITELKKFSSNLKDLISIFKEDPFNEDNRNKSFLRLLSIISEERSKIIETYCSEPE